jgi:hypothetical protein
MRRSPRSPEEEKEEVDMKRIGWAGVAMLAACAGMEEEGTGAIRLRVVCLEDECEREERACEEDRDAQCHECDGLCTSIILEGGDSDCWDTCNRICGRDCDPYDWCDPERCVEAFYSFDLPAERDDELYEACVDALDADRACGWSASDAWCDRPARVYRPEVARAAYACLRELPCAEIPGTCWDDVAPPPGTIGDELCDAMDLACGVDENCDDEVRRDWNEAEPYYRPEVVEALRSCFDEGECLNLQRCADAWAVAVTGPSDG